MTVKFLDLQKQYRSIKTEIDEAIEKVLNSQSFVLGTELEAFEKEFASYIGIKYAVGVNSGTDGLILSLLALGIGSGDEVITPVNSFIATSLAITHVGAKPVFVDCDPDTYQIDVSKVEKNINKKTKAILPVHLYGAPCEIDKIKTLAKENKLFLIEDACQAHGATLNNKKVGTFGDLGVFSFYPGKNLGAYGDGGAVVTNSKTIYEKLKKLRNYGQSKKYIHEEFGVNSRLDEIQAAVLRVKLQYLDEWNEKRRIVAERYINGLKRYKTQTIIKGGSSVYHLFVIEIKERNKIQKNLSQNGIQTLVHYPLPIHLQKAYKHLGYKQGDFPISEKKAKKIISIPLYPELSKMDQDKVIKLLH
jgi:dTDP-4-amino-4,6-dideoxygalactose transaminase